MAKDDKKLLIVAQEIKLVKILAGNNKKLREKTINRLGKWLNDRSSTAPLTEEALMRIWKGLFYAMWMSDKPLIQEDCAEKIAKLVHLNDVNMSLMFFKCFLQTMVNEFFGIDQYRVDKFLMLVRRVLRQTLLVLHENEWQNDYINKFREIINQTVLKIDKNTALGLCLHFNDVFLEELAKISKGELSENKILELIQPFAQQLARIGDKRQIQNIITHIFKHLINQTDVAIEYKEKFDAWKRQGFPGGSIDAMETIPVEEDSVEDVVHETDVGPTDPRAGKVDVILPQIKFDPLAVIKLLEDIKFKKYTTSNGRKAITKLVRQFKLLSEGIYPLGLTKIPINQESYKTSIKSSLKTLENFQKTLTQDSKKSKNKARKHKIAQEIAFEQINNKTSEPQLKKQKKAKTIEEFIQNSESHLFNNKTDTETNELQLKKQKKKTIDNDSHLFNNKTEPHLKQKKAKTIEEFIENSESHLFNNKTDTETNKLQLKKQKKKTIDNDSHLFNNKTESHVKQKKVKTIEEFIENSDSHLLKNKTDTETNEQQLKKQTKKTIEEHIQNSDSHLFRNKTDTETNELQLKKQKKVKTIENFIENSESHLFNKTDTETNELHLEKQKKKTVEVLNQNSDSHLFKTKTDSEKNEQQLKKQTKKIIEELIQNSDSHLFKNKTNELQLKKQKKVKTFEELILQSDSHLFNSKTQSGKKRRLDSKTEKNKKPKILKLEEKLPIIKSQNYFKRNSGMWLVDEFEIPEKSPEKSPSEWEKPLQDGETEYFVATKKSKKKLKRLAEQKNRPVFIEKIMYATPKKQIVKNPFSETPREKKIKFSSKIEAQEFTEHEKQIINSPIIPYDASKKPTKSLLKQSPFSSPINPFYLINK